MEKVIFLELMRQHASSDALARYMLVNGVKPSVIFASLPQKERAALLEAAPQFADLPAAKPDIEMLVRAAQEYTDDDYDQLIVDASSMAIAALKEIGDQDALKSIWYEGRYNGVLKFITDQEFLVKLADTYKGRDEYDTSSYLIPAIRDAAYLRKLVLTSSSKRIRAAALEVIINHHDDMGFAGPDLDEFYHYALDNESEDSLRLLLAGVIQDQDTQQRLLKDVSSAVRKSAMANINQSAVYKNAAMNDPSEEVRSWAVRLVTDHDDLADLALHSADKLIRGWAVKMLDPSRQDVLRQIALHDANLDVANRAGAKLLETGDAQAEWNAIIQEATQLRELPLREFMLAFVQYFILAGVPPQDILYNMPHVWSDKLREKFPGLIGQWQHGRERENILIRIVIHDAHPQLRLLALEVGITDEDVLMRLALTDKTPEIRLAALKRLDDYHVPQLALRDPSPDVRIYAISRVEGTRLLELVAEYDTDPKVQEAAIQRMEKLAGEDDDE